MTDETTNILDDVTRTSVPAGVSILGLSNVCLSNTVYTLTIIYIIFQLVLMYPKVKKTIKSNYTKKDNDEKS